VLERERETPGVTNENAMKKSAMTHARIMTAHDDHGQLRAAVSGGKSVPGWR
jgi:hypothetical protein